MTRRGGEDDIEGGSENFLDTRKGSSEKIMGCSENLYTSKPTGGGGETPKKIEPLVRGAAEISSFDFQCLHPLLVIFNDLSLKCFDKFRSPNSLTWLQDYNFGPL